MADEIHNSVSVKASPDSVTVNLDGRSAHQLSDLLSPFTELGGVLGDKIRVFRQSNAIKGIKKVKDLALELGVDLRPVPSKFLVNWVEVVSLEEDLSDLWAGLLVSRMSGGDNFSDSGYYLFKRILREMDKSSLELIMKIAGTSNGCKFDPQNYTDTFGKFNKLPNADLRGCSKFCVS